MKVFNTIALVFSFVAAGNKKVPPRTPEQRLRTLNVVYQQYVFNFIEPFRPIRAHGHAKAIYRMTAVLSTIPIQDRKCNFFDPNIPNGGPRADYSVNAGRKRRDVYNEDPFDVYEQKYQDGDTSGNVQLSQDSAVALRQVLISRIG